MNIYKIVLMRHGESQWNQLNKFTGWHDIDLSNRGIQEALNAAQLLQKKGFNFNLAYTSVLKRSIHTLWNIIKYLNLSWIPVKKTWHLNERHYGSLEGLNKTDVINKYGYEQVQKWRRSFFECPPKIKKETREILSQDPRYSHINDSYLPFSESLQLTTQRVIPYWKNSILPNLKKNYSIIIVAHGNSLRSLIKFLSNISDEHISKLDIATGSPIIYEFNSQFKPIKYYYL